MSIETFRYTPGDEASIADGLAAFGLQPGGEYRTPYFEEMLSDPDKAHDAVFVARDGDGHLALAFLMPRPVLDGAGRLVMLMLPPEDEDAALAQGHMLMDVAADFLAARGVPRLVNSIGTDKLLQQRIMEERGFEILMPFHNLQWRGDGAPAEAPDVEGVSYEVYTGGEHATNEQMEALWKRAFGSEPLAPGLSPDWIERSIETLGVWFLVARDTASGQVVGFSEAGPDAFFSGIAVARSHWGKSLADALVLRSCNEFMARGHNHLFSLTRRTNAPSLKLQARLGWEIYSDGNIWVSPETG